MRVGRMGRVRVLSEEVCWSLKRDLKQQVSVGVMGSLARDNQEPMTPTLLLC